MKKYTGSCHCGAVKFEIETYIRRVAVCNCSICAKKGAIHTRVEKENFKLVEGEDSLQMYQFNTKTAKHYFCKHCGIHTFGNPRFDPSSYSINIRCLDEFDVNSPDFEFTRFDGQDWEEAVKKLNIAVK